VAKTCFVVAAIKELSIASAIFGYRGDQILECAETDLLRECRPLAKWTFVVWDRRSAVVHRPSLHSRYRFAAADPGPLVRRALLDICAVKSSILERSSLRIGEVLALL
jgi:hypothetical protein